MNIAIIFAGGVGQRLNKSADSVPKQFIEIYGKPILAHTLTIFQNHNEIDKIYISILPEYKEHCIKMIEKYSFNKVVGVVDGGETAQESIYNGLNLAYAENPKDSIVLIHDGVRPIVEDSVISANIKSVKENGTAITSTPCYETILISSEGKVPKEIPIRRETYAAQAPQSFVLEEIFEAHNIIRQRENKYQDIVDSCTLYNVLGKQTHLVKGNFGNIKITTPQDLFILRGILEFKENYESFSLEAK